VAARGLHINDLDLVINFDIPEDFENYVHRIGRTARAGKTGMAVTFACEKFVYGLEAIESYIKMKIPVDWPGEEMFAEDMSKDEFIRSFMRESKQTRIVSEHDDKKSDKQGRDRKTKEKSSSAGRSDRKDHRKTPEKYEDRKVRTKTDFERKPKPAAAENIEKNRPKKLEKTDSKGKPAKDLTLDKRMDYYKERYGEDFKIKREITAKPGKVNKKPDKDRSEKEAAKGTSLISRIKSLFKKK
jgi:ATP-dependent RNA helicase RhlB